MTNISKVKCIAKPSPFSRVWAVAVAWWLRPEEQPKEIDMKKVLITFCFILMAGIAHAGYAYGEKGTASSHVTQEPLQADSLTIKLANKECKMTYAAQKKQYFLRCQ